MKREEKVFLEVVLVLSSVLVFRSLWMLLDKIKILHNTMVLVAMFITGLVVTVAALYKLMYKSR